MERLVIGKENEKHIQAYLEYRNIVGDDDGGKLMSEEEFEAYKKKVAEARKNHLYVYWINAKGFECKAIGPESMCFCGHRYKKHNFDNVKTKKVNCKESKCKCVIYEYIPVYGSNDVKCLCKHSYSLHDNGTRKCSKCTTCVKFGSKFTCNCTMTYDEHKTIIETREERLSKGKAVDPGWMSQNMVAGVGGLNSFAGMINDVYELEYQALLNDPNKKHELMSEIQTSSKSNQKALGMANENNENTLSKNNNQQKPNSITAFDLINIPYKFENGFSDSNINKKRVTNQKMIGNK
jgi:Protein FAM221A/B